MQLQKLIILFTTVAAALACVGLQPASAETPPRPNIVLVVTDDQGYWDTGVSGNEQIDTPVMDQLASEGVSFTRFYASMVCAPTRAGLMTGRYYLRTGLYNTRFGGDTMGAAEVTIAQLLHEAGYRTGLFGKWHLGKYAGYQPHQRGFDEFFGHYHGHIERYDYPDQLVHNGRPIETRGYVTDLLTDAAIDFVEASREQPFFCYLAYNAPHSPFVAGASHDGMPRGDELIEKYLKRGLRLRDARIYAMVELIDQNLGRLLAALDRLEIADNTIVLFTSDNGGVSRAFKAGLRGGKGSAFEGGVRVPFFARWPDRFAAGAEVDAMASHIDVTPTLCELLEIPLPDDRPIDGRSLQKLLVDGKGKSPHPYVYHTWDRYTPNPHNRWGISDGRFKLTGHAPTNRNPVEKPGALFDLHADPGEKSNIAAEHPEVAAQLRREFLRWFNEVTDGQNYRPAAIPVGHPQENPVELQASWATISGTNTQYTFRGYDWDTIDSWREPGDAAAWTMNVLRPGRYEVLISYGCKHSDAGGQLRISAGDAAVTHSPRATPSADAFRRAKLGVLELMAGETELRAEVVRSKGEELMRLNQIWLRKLSDD